MSTPQEYWDACLIKTWRNFGTFKDACNMFRSITNVWPNECDPALLRYPTVFVPYGVQMQYFVANYLPKMNDWLWANPPTKDVDLLRKVNKSKYTVVKKRTHSEDEKERAKIGKETKKDRELRTLKTTLVSERNSATDWNVAKGAGKFRGGRLR
jgi:hypothetical protein